MQSAIVVGAGIAGLTLARALHRQGLAPLVLERSRGVGGRCATRRIDGQAVDHGVAYLHGRTPEFRAELDAVPQVVRREHWPTVRSGDGSPCRPEAFAPDVYRVAFAEGVNSFAKHLATDVAVRADAHVTAVRPPSPGGPEGWHLTLSSGEVIHARALVLTMPAPSALDLLKTGGAMPSAVADVLPLVGLIRMVPCLTLIARYPFAALDASWDVSMPRESEILQLVSHDSGKRSHPDRLVLVIQARPSYSRRHVDTPADVWAAAMLTEAATIHGTWVAHPEFVQAHVWRKARVAPGSELVRPVAVRLDGGELLAFAGDGFHLAGGVEGAYLSGLALANRLTEFMTDDTSTRGDIRAADHR